MTVYCERVLIDTPPFTAPPLLSGLPWDPPDSWPCRWLVPDPAWETPLVLAFRLVVDLAEDLSTRLHVSADERYDLWIDGMRVGSGPERSDEHRWAYESRDLRLPAGRHVLMARVWALGRLAPWAQRSRGPGFLCAAEGIGLNLLSTGRAPWRMRRLGGYRFTSMSELAGTGLGSGSCEAVDVAALDWTPDDARDDGRWREPLRGDPGNDGTTVLLKPVRLLTPASLPAQREAPASGAVVRAVDGAEPWTSWTDEGGNCAAWQGLLAGTALTIPPQRRMRVLIDTGRYWCGRPELAVRGGAGSRIAIAVAESLVRSGPQGERKGHRDPVAGGRVRPVADVLLPAGGAVEWRSLWWRAGRWIELVVTTADEQLTFDRLALVATGYPFAVVGAVHDEDAPTAVLHAACRDTWRACAHETYMDCPHYEQLMYVGDTRVQALLTYALSPDARLPRRCIDLFASGRVVGRGLVPDAYPAAMPKLIPPFALWWVAMVHDFAWWRAAPSRFWLQGVRDLIDRFIGEVGADGLWPSPVGWNFLDATEGFTWGTPPGGEERGCNASFSWQLVLALGQWAELEDWHGEPELATRARRWQRTVAAAIEAAFWDPVRGLYAEDRSRRCFSEHAQILALLSGVLSPEKASALGGRLITDPNLARTSAYFSHYLFEVYGRLGRTDLLLERLKQWHESAGHGLVTTPEAFGGEGRSDCHAWSAHPLFHRLATVLGVRPAAPAFARVRIAPQLGPLESASGAVAHPAGPIQVTVRKSVAGLSAAVELPPGLSGELVWNGSTKLLHPGEQRLEL